MTAERPDLLPHHRRGCPCALDEPGETYEDGRPSRVERFEAAGPDGPVTVTRCIECGAQTVARGGEVIADA